MAIDTYEKLQSAIGDAANRDDLFADVTAYSPATIDGLIKREIADATTGIQRDLMARGGHKSMEVVLDTLVTVGGTETVTFPADFLGHRAFILYTSGAKAIPLGFMDPASLYSTSPSQVPSIPQKFTITERIIARLRPIPDGAYTTRLIYYQALTVLTTTSTNWVLLTSPDIYVARAMWQLSIKLEQFDRAPIWNAQYTQLMSDLMGDERNVRWAGVPTTPSVTVQIV